VIKIEDSLSNKYVVKVKEEDSLTSKAYLREKGDSLTSKAWLKRKRGQFNVKSIVKEKKGTV